MLYRNVKTGIEFESKSAITGPHIVEVKPVVNPTNKAQELPKAPEPPKEEKKEDIKPEPKAEAKKATSSKTTPKKSTKRAKK